MKPQTFLIIISRGKHNYETGQIVTPGARP
nr:MAG TPA: hypothetical protein [Caudoviricetes sp.]